MYAVIRTGSKQYRVEPGVDLLVERLPEAEAGKMIEISDVLMYAEGDEISVGTPVVPMTVQCMVVAEELGEKLRTVKYRRRKNSRRSYGHRQMYTRLLVQKFDKKASN